jgi:hypothetical protein
MISYSYKDVKIQIGGQELYCTNMSISYSAEVTSSYDTRSIYSNKYLPSNSPAGVVDFSYYLTGLDPLVDSVKNHTSPLAFSLGGYTFSSGYLTKYDLQLAPNAYALTNAGLSFYERIDSNFVPASSSLKEIDFLRVGDIRLSDNSYISEDEVVSFSYNYNISHTPVYVVDYNPNHQNKVPHRISFGQKKVECSASITKDDLDLPVTGMTEQFKIKLNDKNENTKQSYIVNGILYSKKASVAGGGRLVNEISVAQANLGVVDSEATTITAFSPVSGNRYFPGVSGRSLAGDEPNCHPCTTGHDRIGITGTNFVNIDSVYLGDFKMEISGDYTENVLTGIIPKEVPTNYWAPIKIYRQGAVVASTEFQLGTGFLVVSGATL